jgi:hypothetical protein
MTTAHLALSFIEVMECGMVPVPVHTGFHLLLVAFFSMNPAMDRR